MTAASVREFPLDATARPVKAPPKAPFSRRTAVAVGLAVALMAAGAIYIAVPKAEVFVDHDQAVRRGQPLVRIDPEEFDARVAAAAADLANARAAVQAAQAAFVTQAAEERLAAAAVRAAGASIESAQAQDERAQADRRRFEALVASGAVARRDAEQYRAGAISARSDVDHSRAEMAVSQSQAAATQARRATLAAGLAQAQAGVARAGAALDLARQDDGHTVIRAPIDGVVGDRHVEPGDYVQPGTRLMVLVPMNALYVTANFKETQVARMLAGQPAVVRVDALPGVSFRGHVASIAPGSGSQFSLLPFEPGTGNFTKIVQRVPVRIALDPGQASLDRLRPGLSTTVTVKLKDVRRAA
jgi:membrane fusion protein (multidrug efflux system)